MLSSLDIRIRRAGATAGLALLLPHLAHAQTENFGGLQFSMPKAVREQSADFVSVTDSSKNAVCRYVVLKQNAGGSPENDYKSAYADMARIIGVSLDYSSPSKVVTLPSGHVQSIGGGGGTRKDGGNFMTELFVYSGGGQRLTAFRYTTSIFRCAGKNMSFSTSLAPLGSVTVASSAGGNAPRNTGSGAPGATPSSQTTSPTQQPAPRPGTPAPGAAPSPAPAPSGSGGDMADGQVVPGTGGPLGARGWQYTSTTFSDGWKSTAMEDWVEGVKGDVTVRLHHPRKEDGEYFPYVDAELKLFWQLLIQPRYRNITNWVIGDAGLGGYEHVAITWADAVDPATNRPVHIVLAKRHRKGLRWVEIVSPSRAVYEQNFGPINGNATDWDRIFNLHGLNKFSVSANDLVGEWSSSWGTAYQLANIFTGDYAGVLTQGSASGLHVNGNRYSIKMVAAQGRTGQRMDIQTELWKGNITVPDPWHVQLTGAFRGETRLLDASFEAVKGGRILRLDDARAMFRYFKVK